MTKPMQEEAQEEFNRRLVMRQQEFKKRNSDELDAIKAYHCPIFGAKPNGHPALVGTATCLRFGDAFFLASAAHVFDECTSTSLYTVANQKHLLLEGTVHKTRCATGRGDDTIDIGVLELNEVTDQLRKVYSFASLNKLAVNETPARNKYYAILGYPATKARPIYGTTTTALQMYSYADFGASDTAYSTLTLSKKGSIAVRFTKGRCLSETGSQVVFPDPYGMSGGGIWLLEDMSKPFAQSHIGKLAGIAIEYHKNKSLLVGTSVEAVIAAIAHNYPSIASDLPSTSFRVVSPVKSPVINHCS